MIKCPNCNESHYTEKYSTSTAMYYPPVWKNGMNVNPDGNIKTTYCHCINCNHDFVISFQYGKVISSKDIGEVKSTNITYTPSNEEDITISTEYATIKNEEEETELHYQWELEIIELKKRIAKLEKDVAELAGEVYELQ